MGTKLLRNRGGYFFLVLQVFFLRSLDITRLSHLSPAVVVSLRSFCLVELHASSHKRKKNTPRFGLSRSGDGLSHHFSPMPLVVLLGDCPRREAPDASPAVGAGGSRGDSGGVATRVKTRGYDRGRAKGLSSILIGCLPYPSTLSLLLCGFNGM